MGGGTGGQFIIEGGELNTAGRLQTASTVSYTQSGGTVNVCTVGQTATTACFGLTASTNTFNMTGGTIVLVLPSGAATPLDWSVSTTSTFTANPAGTTLQIGNGSTPAASNFRVVGNTPNITINTGHTMSVGSGAAGAAIFFRGSTLTNNGAIVVQGTGASSRFDWAASGPMTYGGTGTFGTAATPFAGVGISSNSPTGNNTTINAPIFVNRTHFFSGGFVNSNQITFGNGGSSTTVIQVGNPTTPTNAGTFDVSPVYNTGSGGHIVLHLRSTTLNRMTGFEINPTRNVVQLTFDNNAAGATLAIAGGDLTVTGTLALTNGVILTGSNTLIHNGAATRSTGYVDGNLSRSYTASGAYTYHVGRNGYSPVAANVTAGTGSLTASAIATAQPNIPTPGKALSRYWKLAGTGITSDLTFTYIDPADIPVTATEANFVIMKYDGAFSQPGGTVDTAANTATITGVTSFSDWTLADPLALVAPGVLQLSSSTYSANENAGTVTVTVNRVSGTDGAVTVDYALGGGTATGGATCGAGIDYVSTGGTVSFANGESSKTFDVTLCGDTDNEPDETFDATLSNPTGGATLGTPTTATVTILNDDAPSGGPVTVTATAGTPGPTNYPTVKDAIDAINAGTHQGAITVSIVTSTTETATSVLNSSGAGTALYTSIVIRPVSDGVTVAGPSVQGRGLIELNGADNVTIDGDNPNSAGTNRNLTIQNTAANTTTFTSVIRIALNITTVISADNNIFRNLNIVGSSTGRNIDTATSTTGSENTTFGIFSGPNATGPDTVPNAITSVLTGVATGATASNLIVSNNSVVTAARAVSINGSATTVHTGLQISDNVIGNPTAGDVNQVTAIGITANGATNPVIANNTVYVEGYVRSSGATHGINVGVNSINTVGATIERNRVNRVRNNDLQTFSAFGINVAGSTGSAHTLRNNFVSGVINSQVGGTGGFGTTLGAYGIRIISGTNHKIYHNSVHLYGAMQGVTDTNLTAAFLVASTFRTGLDVRNNIFSNQITGGNPAGTKHTAIFLPSAGTSALSLTLNNNIYFQGTDPLSTMAQVGSTFATSVAYQSADFNPASTTPATNFRSYSSTLSAAGTNDNASKAVNPQFVSNTDLHILPVSLAESMAADVGVTDDIDGDPRSVVPDIGADEISVAGPGVLQFSSTGFSGSEGTTATITVIRTGGSDGTVGVTATVTNGTATGGAACTAGVDYINPGPQVLTLAMGVVSQTFTVDLCTDMTLEPGETVMLTLSNPTGGATIGTNNPATLTIIDVPPPFSGTIAVGAGETFTSLTNPGGVFQAINNAGLSGNLTVNITSDLTAETGVVPLNQFTETGAGGYTLIFKPSGAPRTVSGTAAALSMIKLNGADRVTFDGSLSGGTDRSLTLLYTNTGGTVVWIASADATNGANSNTFKNCIIASNPGTLSISGVLGGSGVILGGAAQSPNNNNTIQNNHIFRVQNSLYNQGNTGLDQNWTVTENTFGSTIVGDKNSFRGMLMGNAQNFTISNNVVNGVSSSTATTAAMSGIQLAFNVNTGSVVNNRISDLRNNSASGTGAFGMQFSAAPAVNITVANNFISDVITLGSATIVSNGHGINVNGAASAGGYKIFHNSVNMNTNQTTGTTSALNVTAAVVAAGAIDLRNNILANTQTAGATRRAVHSAAPATVFGTINFNDYFSTGSVGFIGGVDRPTLADWKAGTGQDANSLAVDPLFVSPTDLHLQAASPMRNMGVAGTGIITDIDGETRDATPDIGADELPAIGMPGTLQFSAPTYSVGESGPVATITVTRTGGTDGIVTAQYATVAGGTATGGASCGAGIDYVNTSGTVTFVGGDNSETFTVPICSDSTFEPDETVNMALSNPTGGATIGTPATAVLTITDDDPMPGSLSINDVRMFEGDSGKVVMVFTVSYAGSPVPVS
ncbi:MAG: hypothetical protein H0U23_08845, partial [Blastocatellia bacterium]|nr:hypothetical protein [Blastocatellia bacterium]